MNRLVRNSISGALRSVIIIPAFFLITPYVISKIGLVGFGVWALTGVVAGYQNIVDFGLTQALIKYTAETHVDGHYKKLSNYLVTSVFVYVVIGFALLTPLIFFRENIVLQLLDIKSDIEVAQFLIVTSGCCVFVNLISGLFKSVIDGLQRIDVSNIILTVQVVISSVGTFLFLNAGWGLKGLGINLLISSIVVLLINILICLKLLPSINFSYINIKWAVFREMFSYSVNLQLSNLSRFWIEPLNKIIIAHFFSLSYVAVYDLASKVSGQINGIINAALVPLFPAAAETNKKFGLEKVDILRKKSHHYLYSLLSFIYLIIILSIPGFISIWLKSNNAALIARTTQIFLISSYFISLAIPAYTILNALGHARDTLFIQLQSAFVNVCGVILFSLIFGFYGFSAGFSLSIAYGFFATLYYYKKRVAPFVPINFISEFLNFRLAIILFIIITVIICANTYLPVNTYGKIALLITCTTLLYVFLLFSFKILDKADVKELLGDGLYSRFLTTVPEKKIIY